MGCLRDALDGYRLLGFDPATDGDQVFRQLVLTRVIEPTSKLDTLRAPEEAGMPPSSYRTITRVCRCSRESRGGSGWPLPAAGHAGLGPVSLVSYDVSTLYFDTAAVTGSASRGFSKQRHLEPQITIELFADASRSR